MNNGRRADQAHESIFRTRQVPRRGVLKLGGGLAAAATGFAGGTWLRRGVSAQDPSAFTRETKITSWGFGVQETNPLAFARVDAFRQAYPTIELEVVEERTDEKLLAAVASDSVPDLVWQSRFATASWASRDVFLPLDDFIARDGFDTSRFYEAAMQEITYDGKIYGIPGGMDVQILYVNLDHLAEAGVDPASIDTANWEQLTDLGSQLLKQNGDVVERWGFDHKMQGGFFHLWSGANGGALINEDGSEVTFDDPKAVEALDWGVRTYDAQGGFQSYEAVASSWAGDEQFAQGQVAMTMYQSWMLTGVLARVNPALNFRILPVKQRSGEGFYSVAGGNAWFIPAKAKDPEAAWEFIKFMHTDETWLIGANAVKQARQEAGVAYMPSLTASKTADQAQLDQVYEPVDPKFDEAVRLYLDLLPQSRPNEFYISPVGQTLEDTLTQEGILPGLRKEKSAEEALKSADEAAQDEIDFA
jgi:multiple sugar transport system substrate-binding protein